MSEDIRSKIFRFYTQYKINGCAETGRPDKNDWIITCEGQSVLYPLIIEAIELLENLI